MDNLDLNYLKYFFYVVNSNGFTRAAEALHVQQPVISRAIKLLEQQLGFKLLERQKKQIILTTEGKEVYQLAQKVFLNAGQITAYAKDRHEQTSGDLCFATSDSLAPDAMGSVLKNVIQKYPGVRPIHHAGPAQLLIDKIRSGTIEFGMFFNVPDLPADLEKSKLTNVPFEFVIAKELAKNKTTMESFIASKEQDDDESSRLPLFEKYKAHHKGVKVVAVSSSSMARKSLVLNGLGVTILPRFLVRTELKNGTFKSIHEGDYSLPLYLVERKSSYRTKIKHLLISEIKKTVEG
ncbi:LysR family transcriptional regulator [Bdellovibrio sp. HCB2-146]|uniref:LysR family transcriptional regulator n=1 Tax=Bdellovibrio sp. HCB2-146 TaxID=3394362 RepID=UPI0039BD182B